MMLVEKVLRAQPDSIWLDEEPPLSVYTECLLRTMTGDNSVDDDIYAITRHQ
jgi:phage terminase large subunit-like protein